MWLVTAAFEFVTPGSSYARLNKDTFFNVTSSYNYERAEWETKYPNIATWIAMTRVLGLPTDGYDRELFELGEDRFVSEAGRLLRFLHTFSYEHEGSLTFGLALARVEPGEFVFRTSGAINPRSHDGGPSMCGLDLCPYHESSSAGPATFRLVGMCIDYYPEINDPEIVDVIFV